MSQHVVRRLRPYLFTNFSRSSRWSSSQAAKGQITEITKASNDYRKRVEHLETSKPRHEWYPRMQDAVKKTRLPIAEYIKRFDELGSDETNTQETAVVGRIQSIRTAGSKLIFVTILDDENPLQIVIKHTNVPDLKAFAKIARKGDTYAFVGLPHRTAREELSLLAVRPPHLLSPSLHQIPEKLSDSEVLSHHRHVRMLIDPEARRTLKIRHTVERTIDDFLCSRDFTKVSTPILQAGAGGAVARPFETEATEMSAQRLQLRIAPELWLKRLIVGGMSRVYEIGPVFRNEGVDATHNPEFTMCEFYAAYATLDDLMHWTEQLILRLHSEVAEHQQQDGVVPGVPFAKLEFIPAVESKLGHALPDLEASDCVAQLKDIFAKHDIHLPSKPSLPRLLDALAGHFVEPDCDKPTFIIHHPAVLSPLSKQFRCPKTGQLVSARAELFINHCEIANMYEEQNSPFEQRRLFIDQLEYRAIDGESDGKDIDHAYLEALEWALPPTGGWGCGIDRLVMLLAGKSKIGDTLSFGGLRNVVGTGKGR